MAKRNVEILLVEDDRPQAELVRGMLAEEGGVGYAVTHVQYLADALGMLQGRSFDCILVDLGLPDSQGLETALSLRRQARRVPIVVLTVLDDEEAALKSLQMDMQDYLVKEQITAAVLTRAIRYAMQRKIVAEELAASERRFAYFMSHLPAAAWIKDLEGRYRYCNNETARLFARAPHELLGMSDEQILPPEAALQLRENDRRVAESGGSLETTETLPTADGSRRSYLVRKFVLPDDDGEPGWLGGVAFDVTAAKEAQDALLLAKEQWERTFDSVPDLIAILDERHRIVRVNRSMAERLGRNPEELAGTPCYTAFHGTDLPPAFCPHLSGAGSGLRQTELNEPYLGGYFLVTNTPLLDAGGDSLGMVHVARDITELKRAEEEIEQLNGKLAARACELEAANRELESFTYTAAHDLRQPLNVISGYCQAVEMICGGELDQQCLGYLQDIHRGTLRMGRIMDSLLTFSRMGRVQLQKKRIDLSALAREVAEDLKKGDPERGEVSFRIDAGMTVEGDPELVRIVLDNLMGNAWKYTAGTPAPLIEVGATGVNGETVFLVRDNGAGFDMSEAHRLFAPFQRLPGAEGRRGFGIGLATVERIVLRHGGRVWAEGEPGKGATFYFVLPPEES